MKYILSVAVTLGMLTSCGSAPEETKEKEETVVEETTPVKEEKMNSVFEIAINQSKEDRHQEFLDTRAAFVEVLGKEEATLNEGKWQPFFTVIPDMDLARVLVGMTEWSSILAFGEAAGRLLPQTEAVNYFGSFNPLAYAVLETVDGEAFDMETIKKEGSVVEFAIRKGKTDDSFGKLRDTFFNSLENYQGYQFAREFTVKKMNEQGMPELAENTQAVIIVWDNAEDFQAAATPIFASEEYNNFAASIDVETYFATSPTK